MADAATRLYRRLVPKRARHWRHLMRFYLSESSGVASLAPAGPARVWLALVRLVLGVKVAFPAAAVRRATLPVRVEPAGRVYLSHWCDLLVLGEIYQQPREYEFAQLPAGARTIVDLGANVGFSALYLSERYPEARIYAYEPDPEVLRVAERNLRGHPSIELRLAAAAAAEGTIELNRFPGGSWGTSMFVTFQEVTDSFAAKAVTLDSIIAELGGIDILKIDIEGAEYDVLAASRELGRVGCIVGEVHPLPDRSGEELFAQLDGFELVSSDVRDGQGPFMALRRERADDEPAAREPGAALD